MELYSLFYRQQLKKQTEAEAQIIADIAVTLASGGVLGVALKGTKITVTALNKIKVASDLNDKLTDSASIGARKYQLEKNLQQGKLFEQQEFPKFADKVDDAVEQITIKTSPEIKIRVDAIGKDRNTGNVLISEFKSSETAPLTPNQKVGFSELEIGVGTVVGKGKGIFTTDYEIPAGTKVII